MSQFKAIEGTISLHGLGFIQIKLKGNQRLHVWHPGLPRRRCFRHSQIHDHRFGFDSRVLVGEQVNVVHAFEIVDDETLATHIAYLHEGERSKFGGRPWLAHLRFRHVGEVRRERVSPGETYRMLPYVYHSTEPGGDGRVATIMTKTSEDKVGAHSVCEIGVEPDADFDRFQLSDHALWNFVREVLA
jgi:hypothetical protein